MFQANEAIIVHACATPYRERSHFDGQDVLESGLPNRAERQRLAQSRAASLDAGRPRRSRGQQGLCGRAGDAAGGARSGAGAVMVAAKGVPPASDDTCMRLLDLYRHTDPKLAQRAGRQCIGLAAIERAGGMAQKPGGPGPGAAGARLFRRGAGTAAKFLAQPDGPRVGALALDGWDTHVNEGIANGRLSQLLGALDAALAAVETNMGPAWRETVVVLVTEFGRTAHINGTEGTDHGTGTVALLAGGALKGGRVIADWPGLKDADLYENRDLKPTTDLRAVLKGVLKDHLRADDRALAQNVFPGISTRP
jgi:uncharacterized protein (DUF1501 family)